MERAAGDLIRRQGMAGGCRLRAGLPGANTICGLALIGNRGGNMQIRRMGRSGLKVSEICLGTMTFGHQCDERTSMAIMDKAADKGVTFLDTADVYPAPPTLETVGRTEEIVGRWLHGQRARYVLATKCGLRVGPGPNDA